MDIKEIKDFLEANKETDDVKGLMTDLTPNFETALGNEDFSKAMKSYADKEARRQVDSYREKTLPGIVEDQVRLKIEATQHKEPWEIKIAELEANQEKLTLQLKTEERSKLVQKNKTKAMSLLAEKKLPTDLVDFFISDEEEKTVNNIAAFSNVFENYEQELKQNFIKNNNTFVPSDNHTIENTGLTMPPDGSSQAEYETYYRAKRKLDKEK